MEAQEQLHLTMRSLIVQKSGLFLGRESEEGEPLSHCRADPLRIRLETPRYQALELLPPVALAEIWERHDAAAATSRVKRFLHPELGLVRFVATSRLLSERPEV